MFYSRAARAVSMPPTAKSALTILSWYLLCAISIVLVADVGYQDMLVSLSLRRSAAEPALWW